MSTNAEYTALLELFNEARSAAKGAERVKVPLRPAEKIRPLGFENDYIWRKAPTHEPRPLPRNPFPPVKGIANLTFPAPRREALPTESGGWVDQPWSREGVQRELSSGGYFVRGQHDFESASVSFLALNRKEREAAVAKAPRQLFGDEILEAFWAQQSALLPTMS
jgi:hypothetical protein